MKSIISLVLILAIFCNSNLAFANQYANGGGITYTQFLGGKEVAEVPEDLISEPVVKIKEMRLVDGVLELNTGTQQITVKLNEGQFVGMVTGEERNVSFRCDASANLTIENYMDNCAFSHSDGNNVTFFDPISAGLVIGVICFLHFLHENKYIKLY